MVDEAGWTVGVAEVGSGFSGDNELVSSFSPSIWSSWLEIEGGGGIGMDTVLGNSGDKGWGNMKLHDTRTFRSIG